MLKSQHPIRQHATLFENKVTVDVIGKGKAMLELDRPLFQYE